MGKAVAIVLLLALVGIAVLCAVLVILHVRDNVSAQRWARAKLRARWEEHTTMSRDCAEDGTPIAVVTVRLVARLGRRSEELDYVVIATVPVAEVNDPALLDARAKAMTAADVRNGIRAAGE